MQISGAHASCLRMYSNLNFAYKNFHLYTTEISDILIYLINYFSQKNLTKSHKKKYNLHNKINKIFNFYKISFLFIVAQFLLLY